MTKMAMTKHDQYLLESQMSADAAIAWAERQFEETGKWPTRRYRVDGTSVGNSRFMRQHDARDTLAKYGGELREMVPDREGYQRLCNETKRKSVLGG